MNYCIISYFKIANNIAITAFLINKIEVLIKAYKKVWKNNLLKIPLIKKYNKNNLIKLYAKNALNFGYLSIRLKSINYQYYKSSNNNIKNE